MVFEPGIHNLNAPLTIAAVSNITLCMRGAVLRAVDNMPYLIDINGIAYSNIEGGWLTTAPGITVGTMVRYAYSSGARTSTRNRFVDMVFEKGYGVGLQIGHEANGLQTDNTSYENITFIGGANNHETLYQCAIKMIQATFANTMLHAVRGVSIGAHKTGVLVDKVRHVVLEGVSIGGCLVDFDIRATNHVEITGCRSENSVQFLKAAITGVTYPQSVTLRGCMFDSPNDAQATMIEFTQGTLNIDNLQVANVPTGIVPQIKAGYGLRKAFVNVRGYQVSTDASFVVADLFDVDSKANVDAFGLVRLNASEQIDNECVMEYTIVNGEAA